MNLLSGVSFPVHTMDLESSSLTYLSYPIEIGIARWHGPGSPIESWSTLIRPTEDWLQNHSWTDEAQALHGLSKSDLKEGLEPSDALAAASDIAGYQTLLCDGGPYDAYWLARLAVAAEIDFSFKLGDWQGLIAALPVAGQDKVSAWQQKNPARHRARLDAERHLRAIAHLVDESPASVDFQT